MPLYQKILFPLDYSPPCDAILPYVCEMARRPDAELTVLHCLPLSVYAPIAGPDLGIAPARPPGPVEREAEAERLATHCETSLESLAAHRIIADGDPAHAIVECVKKYGIDLVMMPTHGAGQLRRLLLGSVAAKVLHDIGCPVWTAVHGHLLPNANANYRSIVCALASHSEEEHKVVMAAAALASDRGARLTLVRVVEPPPPSWAQFTFEHQDSLIAYAQQSLQATISECNITAGIRVAYGSIPEGIHEAALQEQADLIVVGRGHAREGMGRIWSHLYDTIRQASCPPLSV